MPVIKVENLSKEYRLGTVSHHTMAKDMQSWWARVRGKEDPNSSLDSTLQRINASTGGSPSTLQQFNASTPAPDRFWALKDVSFEVKQGEVLGIIGRNGAGKSTLLKILSKVTTPTKGQVTITGRIASLLEVGTGFHPELTGRENVFLNGAILGMSKEDIRRKFDEIVAFAEIDKFIDTPVKRYSSGMYVRLAFGVAAHLEPEILIIDEVLAVGDAAFQKKCLGKMGEVGREGRTVIFVSHNMEAVRKLCTSGILFENGKIIAAGKIESIIEKYITTGQQNQSEYLIPLPKEDVPGFAYKLVVEDYAGTPSNEIVMGKPWQIRVCIKIIRPIEHFIVGLGFLTGLNMPLRTCWSDPQNIEPGEYQAVFREDTLLFTSGIYPIVIGLSSKEKTFQFVEDTCYLNIAEISNGLELVKTQGCGLILNKMQVDILKI